MNRILKQLRFAWLIALLLPLLALAACDDDDDNGGRLDQRVHDMPVGESGPTEAGTDQAPAGDISGADAALAAVQEVDCAAVTAAAEISMEGVAFVPPTVTINAGEVVRWTNNDILPHTVTSGNPGQAAAGELFDSGTMMDGDSICYRFNESGSYAFYCTLHPVEMDDGVVVVQ